MGFNRQKFEFDLGSNTDATKIHKYKNTNDTLATMVASGYFNPLGTDSAAQLVVGDLIYVVASNDQQFLKVTSVTTNVTTAQFSEVVDDGSITTAKIADLAVTNAKVADNTLTGNKVSEAGSGETTASIVVGHRGVISGGATSNTDIVLEQAFRLIAFQYTLNGSGTASDTIQVFNGTGANNITEAIDISSGSANDIFTAQTRDNAFITFAASETLRITLTDGGGSDVPGGQWEIWGYTTA